MYLQGCHLLHIIILLGIIIELSKILHKRFITNILTKKKNESLASSYITITNYTHTY